MHRRHFIRSSAAATFSLASVQSLFGQDSKSPYVSEMGLQLYTLRDQLTADVPATLKVVAEAGYRQVEPYGFPEVGAVVTVAKDLGLKVNSTHFDWHSITDAKTTDLPEFQKILEAAHDQSLSHLVIPYVEDNHRATLDAYKLLADKFNIAAAMARKAEIQLAYHNHNFEFEPKEDGKTGYQVFMETFSPEMMFEVDVFWVQVAGLDPVELIGKLNDRVSQLHLKDLKKGFETPFYGKVEKDAFKEIGNGTVNIEAIMAAAATAKVKHCHVEQDQSPDPLQSVRTSMANLAA